MNVPLTLVVLGLVAGLATAEDRLLMTTVTLIALPIVGTALTQNTTIGAQLNAVAHNLPLAMAGALATAIAIRLYHLTMDGVTGLVGASSGGTAAAAAR
jgi:hypothetical protein